MGYAASFIYDISFHTCLIEMFSIYCLSALDNESEAIVQAAIDKLMESREHTVILIAHR